MKTVIFILTYVTLAVLYSGCGDARTSAHLRSAAEIQAVASTFIVGKTKISDVYDALGPWQKAGSSPNTVTYWTSDGGETTLEFSTTCVADPADSGCYSNIQHTN